MNSSPVRALLLLGLLGAAACQPAPSRDFEGSFAFPRTRPEPREPWKSFDFEARPEAYLNAVYAYVREGNIDAEGLWRMDVQRWFHVPGFDTGAYGRESLQGLTRERSSRPGELHVAQTHCAQNWAVGFYNDVGAHTLGEIASEACAADGDEQRADVQFAEGSVAAKLLFTSATPEDVPYLRGAYQTQAVVHRDRHLHGDPAADAFLCRPETPATDAACSTARAALRLIQLDVAIKDARSTSGWVFGTFVYDGDAEGRSPWERMRPVGLSWGDGLDEQRILASSPFKRLGCEGRLNGPVDSPKGSCMSCHGRASEPYAFDFGPAPACAPAAPAARVASPAPRSFDFSLQVAMGRAQLCAKAAAPAPVAAPAERRSGCACKAEHADAEPAPRADAAS